jgi:hypothetical protein
LLLLPESGMGYQIIEANRRNNYSKERFIVYNCELIVEKNEYFENNKKLIFQEGYTKIFSKSDYLELYNLRVLKSTVFSNVRMLSEINLANKKRHSGGKGAIDNEPVYANGVDKFVRLSPYPNDFRIDTVNMRLTNGSFTTTEADYINCKMFNDDPIDRYALPSDEKINWAYFIQPKSYDQYRPGIVQPANNHNGGGIEALFDNGTSNNTYLGREQY